MKKNTIIILVILALMVSMLPFSTAFAKPSSTVITVRNQTGSPVTLVIQNASATRMFTVANGGSEITVASDYYTYVAQTVCGVKSGKFNMSRMAVLHFSCVKGEQIKLARPRN